MPSQDHKTRQSIIDILKREGRCDAASLAERLEVSAMAVRQHLYDLHRDGLVDSIEQPRPRGRPAKLWGLTADAEAFFPNGHAELVCDLIAAVREAFGNEGLQKMVARRSRQQMIAYGKKMDARRSLGRQLRTLAGLRSKEGYMAEVERKPDGSYLFIENHCAICAAAESCQSLCSGELDVFRHVLGADVEVERTEHIVAGDRRCAYRVTSSSASK